MDKVYHTSYPHVAQKMSSPTGLNHACAHAQTDQRPQISHLFFQMDSAKPFEKINWTNFPLPVAADKRQKNS